MTIYVYYYSILSFFFDVSLIKFFFITVGAYRHSTDVIYYYGL